MLLNVLLHTFCHCIIFVYLMLMCVLNYKMLACWRAIYYIQYMSFFKFWNYVNITICYFIILNTINLPTTILSYIWTYLTAITQTYVIKLWDWADILKLEKRTLKRLVHTKISHLHVVPNLNCMMRILNKRWRAIFLILLINK